MMTAQKCRIKKGDRVIVVTGKNRGKSGEVSKVFPSEGRVLVGGVNLVRRHLKVSAGNPHGIVEREAKIHISNVALVDPVTKKPTKVGFKFLEDGTKARYAKDSGEIL